MDDRDDWHLTESVPHEDGRGDPFAAAIRGARMPMIITDPRLPDNPIVFANAAFQHLSGYGRQEVVGRNCRFLQGPGTDPASIQAIRDAVAEERPVDVDLLNYRKDGTTFWNALHISPVRGRAGGVQFFFASQIDISGRVEAQRVALEQKAAVEAEVRSRTADLQAALDEKTLLLQEVDHRVKNNLTMIGSLLRLQSRTLKDPRLSATIENMLSRVDALATVHRRLYQSGDVSRFDLGAFATTLLNDVVGSSGRSNIVVRTAIEPVMIQASQATAMGLILNELVTNAIKHAFADGRPGTLRLAIRESGGRIRVELDDDGPGFDTERLTSSMGRMLITRLSKQIGAETVWRSGPSGTSAALDFPSQTATPGTG